MGLCKCPKKKVTNQFCFEHRVNVCEHCIVSDHTTCVVQSYLQWLNDSLYNPTCHFCKDPLVSRECTRLVCYDVFHTSCLHDWGASHPPNTAPAGYKCPVCLGPVFPMSYLASPVALALKETLRSWPWANKMESSCSTDEEKWRAAPKLENQIDPKLKRNSDIATHSKESKNYDPRSSAIPESVAQNNFSNESSSSNHAAVSSSFRDRSHSLRVSSDYDESDVGNDKYKRKSTITWFKRWLRTNQPLMGPKLRTLMRRKMLIGLTVVLMIIVFLLLTHDKEDDYKKVLEPAFDPLHNPNVHVQED